MLFIEPSANHSNRILWFVSIIVVFALLRFYFPYCGRIRNTNLCLHHTCVSLIHGRPSSKNGTTTTSSLARYCFQYCTSIVIVVCALVENMVFEFFFFFFFICLPSLSLCRMSKSEYLENSESFQPFCKASRIVEPTILYNSVHT